MDVRRTILYYLAEFVTGYKQNVTSVFKNCEDGPTSGGSWMNAEDVTRRLLMSLQDAGDVQEMFDVHGDVIVKITDTDGNTLLSQTAKDGHLDLANLLLIFGADVNHKNSAWNTPLLLAVAHNQDVMAGLLIKAGADVNCCNKQFETPLKLAAGQGRVKTVVRLLEAGACPDYMNKPGDTALRRACVGGHVSVVQVLLASGADVTDVNNTDDDGLSLLMTSAKRQNVPSVYSLLQGGACINSRHSPYDGDVTSLTQAPRQSQVDIMHILALAGADINTKNTIGHSQLSIAILYKNTAAVKCLLAHGLDINQPTKSGATPLILAAERGCVQFCQEFVTHGAEIDAVNEHGDTALIQATRNGHPEVIKVLINAGSNVNHINNSMISALRFAVGQSLFSCSQCLMYLLESGVTIHSELHYAVMLGLTHVVKQFISFNALPRTINAHRFFPSFSNQKHLSPLCVALIADRVEIVKFFLEIVFLVNLDLTILNGNPEFRRHLKDRSRGESVHFLDCVLSLPLSLYSLSFLAVSTAVGFDSRSRQARVHGTGLPPLLQRRLMFAS
ncbi:hypothetical protein BsWGS_16481 [Bradybaena similaris]